MLRYLLPILVTLILQASADPVVTVNSGRLKGVTGTNGVTVFRGIPYARPPVGPLRWRAPEPAEPWEAVRDCSEFAPSCPQPPSKMGIGPAGQSEDCLYLNVWTTGSGDRARPVIVWIHGGGFVMGSGSQSLYDGSVFAQNGIVLVTLNYRLGPFGFLAHPLLSEESSEGVSGNYGLLDVIAALRWVQDNIHVFGGDPGNVTMMGESSGAVSVGCLLTAPAAQGLFHRAVMESGVPELKTRLSAAEEQGEKIASGLELSEITIESLRSVSAERLLETANPSMGMFSKGNKMGPVIDGWLLPEEPLSRLEAGDLRPVPVLLGTNSREGSLFYKQLNLDTPASYEFLVRRLFVRNAEKILDQFPAQSEAEVPDAAINLFTVARFTAPARRTARILVENGYPVWLYEFDRSNRYTEKMHLGATHGSEIPYVFGTLPQEFADEDDRALSVLMNQAWSGFASSGDLSAEWPAYTLSGQDFMAFGVPSKPGKALRQKECDLLDSVRP